MSSFIASYDLKETNPSPHSEFLEQAKKHGWRLWILGHNDIWYRLPNTTLVGDFSTISAAESALEATRIATAAALGKPVTMEKWIIATYSDSRFNSDMTQRRK